MNIPMRTKMNRLPKIDRRRNFSHGSNIDNTKVDSNHILRRHINAPSLDSGMGPYCDFLTLGGDDTVEVMDVENR